MHRQVQRLSTLLGAVAAHGEEDEYQSIKNQVRYCEHPVGGPQAVRINDQDNEDGPEDPVG